MWPYVRPLDEQFRASFGQWDLKSVPLAGLDEEGSFRMEDQVAGSLTSVRSNCKEFGMTYGGKPLWSRSFRSTTLRGKENSPILDGVVSTDSTHARQGSSFR